jgi:hypothetical protein
MRLWRHHEKEIYVAGLLLFGFSPRRTGQCGPGRRIARKLSHASCGCERLRRRSGKDFAGARRRVAHIRRASLLLARALLIVGIYLIEDQFTNPLASQSIGLFAAAFVLASALALLYELIELPRIFWRSGGQLLAGLREAAKAARAANSPVACAARSPARALCDLRANLPYQRCYVDRVRVRS